MLDIAAGLAESQGDLDLPAGAASHRGTDSASRLLPSAARLALLAALSTFVLGGLAVIWGLTEGSVALWGFGAAALLQIPTALGLRGRLLDGLGNRGLDRELRTLRATSHLMRLLAVGLALAALSALVGSQAPEPTSSGLGLALACLGLLAPLWRAKQRHGAFHPTLALDAARIRTLLELAGLLLAGSLLGRWFPWADGATGLGLGLRLYVEGHAQAKRTALKVACGDCCGGGCGGD